LNLRDYPLEPFQDLRHHGDYAKPEGNALSLLEASLDCDDLVFVTPVYWYSVPAPLKLYLDYWSHWMRVAETGFKESMRGKNLWAVSCSAGPAIEAQHMFASLELSAKYMEMNWSGFVLGNGSAAGDVLTDDDAVEKARVLFQ
ncbi:MAG: NAD(P)H-dependent oxidoreductase, partial [Planctomycetota bacterium]